MTPQEELFAKFFNHETEFVKDMDVLTLRAHIEELEKCAFEARARLTAATERAKSKKDKDSPGFTRSVQMDDISSNAINQINARKEKLSKKEKDQQKMIEVLGMDPEYVRHLYTNSAIADQKEKERSEGAKPKIMFPSPNAEMKDVIATITEKKPFVNPFDKKTGE